MGATKQIQIEEAEEEAIELDREHSSLGSLCPYCHGDLDRESCEMFRHESDKDD